MSLLGFVLAFIGFNLLCVNTGRNANKIVDMTLTLAQQRLLTLVGWVALVMSLWPMLTIDSISIALINWAMLLTLAACTVILLLTYRPKLLAVLAKPVTHWLA
ncbi:DUF3325 domain-containing protein [Shewanella sp. C32]|uniref:DUF3325 domain-containing protein n=1 Tax=Shewanella electrica TaxID=515560 RepID=A0ABT2FJJ1_9GAMM|nr:DUF3325 domain-containing protein [Shewanella electrica]MCH1924258.1 DUF3325 domain-containing protein [Shewanella electrica]MCS4556161.1 DUF3325 domain-containing protein [Shewanella electrica]